MLGGDGYISHHSCIHPKSIKGKQLLWTGAIETPTAMKEQYWFQTRAILKQQERTIEIEKQPNSVPLTLFTPGPCFYSQMKTELIFVFK